VCAVALAAVLVSKHGSIIAGCEVRNDMDEQPSLRREIGKVAWLFAKVIGVVAIVTALFAWLIYHHPVAGMIAFCCVVFGAQIAFLGWQNYKSKLKDLEWKRKWAADEEKWKRAS
jgi:hypothetical protein